MGLRGAPVDDAADALTQVRHVEVEQESDLAITEFEIRQQLGRVDR